MPTFIVSVLTSIILLIAIAASIKTICELVRYYRVGTFEPWSVWAPAVLWALFFLCERLAATL